MPNCFALKDRSAVADGADRLAATQSRASPEADHRRHPRPGHLHGSPYQQTFTVGAHPFGAGPGTTRGLCARRGGRTAGADGLERARLAANAKPPAPAPTPAQAQLAAAERRAGWRGIARLLRQVVPPGRDRPAHALAHRGRGRRRRATGRARPHRTRRSHLAWRQALGLLPHEPRRAHPRTRSANPIQESHPMKSFPPWLRSVLRPSCCSVPECRPSPAMAMTTATRPGRHGHGAAALCGGVRDLRAGRRARRQAGHPLPGPLRRQRPGARRADRTRDRGRQVQPRPMATTPTKWC